MDTAGERQVLKNHKGEVVKQLFTIGVFVAIVRHAGTSKEELLLVQHKRDGRWSLPGGGLEDDELPTQCGVREVQEESGLVVDILDGDYVGTAMLRKKKQPHDEVHLFHGRILDDSGFLPAGNGTETMKAMFWQVWQLDMDEEALEFRPDMYPVQLRLIQRFRDWQYRAVPFYSQPKG